MSAAGQFEHPLVLRAKLEIAAACHAFGKTPSHCVVTEFKDTARCRLPPRRQRAMLGYTRMWSIHPAQIRIIVDAFAPSTAEVDQAIEILLAAQAAGWAPIRHRDTLHDRASYRYFWHVLTSYAGGAQLPAPGGTCASCAAAPPATPTRRPTTPHDRGRHLGAGRLHRRWPCGTGG
jgi:citrate lyase subunit beta / citryl-CoA lyase